jgi:hypothetical protein
MRLPFATSLSIAECMMDPCIKRRICLPWRCNWNGCVKSLMTLMRSLNEPVVLSNSWKILQAIYSLQQPQTH